MILKLSTARNRMFFLGPTLTGAAFTISKDGGAFGAAAGTITAVGTAGWYVVALAAGDTGTVGDLAYLFTVSAGVLLLTGAVDEVQPSVLLVNATGIAVKKNAALAAFEFVMTDSTNHVPTAGLTVTATRSIDGAAFGACANAVVAVGNGVYKIDLAASDLNGNTIGLRFTAAASDDLNITMLTQS